MKRSRTLFSAGCGVAALVSLLVAGALVVAPWDASAAVSVKRASLSSGTLAVEGRGARANATITVSSAESTATGKADSRGEFKFSASGFASSNCKATVGDGSTSVAVTLSGCTPASAPPPATAPRITPDVAEIGPGFVGSDFTTHSTTTTTMTLGPDALGPVRFEIIAGQLPAGLSLKDPNAGFTPAKSVHASIAGVPTTVQTSTFTVRATDANGLQATRTYTIRINPAITLAITPQQWAPLTVGSFGNLWIDGSGGVRPYRWARTAGALPTGMSLIQDNPNGPLVRVGGTPTTRGTFGFTLRLTDAQGATVSRTFSVTVS
jgi:Putative Ig domain